jgi:hypothetical protein
MSESSSKRLSWSKSEKYNDPMNIELGILFQVLQELRAVTRSAKKHQDTVDTVRDRIYNENLYGGGYVGKQLRRIKAVLSPDYGRKRSAYKAVRKETGLKLDNTDQILKIKYQKRNHLGSKIKDSLFEYIDLLMAFVNDDKILSYPINDPDPIDDPNNQWVESYTTNGGKIVKKNGNSQNSMQRPGSRGRQRR